MRVFNSKGDRISPDIHPFTFADCGLMYGTQEQPGSGQEETGAVNKFQHKYGIPEEGNGFVRRSRVLVPTQIYGDIFFLKGIMSSSADRNGVQSTRLCWHHILLAPQDSLPRSAIRYLNHDWTHWLIVLIVPPEA